ncbi:MAG: M28 family peptidase [Candidatus Thorarchaeota archaeon]|nr:MAG: M28 family peptidase [Candidatus Thorarchaeota archaeon]
MSDSEDTLGPRLKDFITTICEDVGPRLGTSDEESLAGTRIEEEYKRLCDSTCREEFTCHPAAFLDSVRISVFVYIVGLVFYYFAPILTAIFGSLALGIFAAELMYLKEVVDPIFPEKTGYNVYGKILPKDSTKRIALVSGHHDSAYEFPIHERLGSRFPTFILLTIGLGLITIIISILRLLLLSFLPSLLTSFDWITFVPVVSAFPMLVFAFRLRSNKVVLGANDNLSAVAVTLGVGEWLQNNPLEHTEVWLVSFACEENMRGSKRFASRHKEELQGAYLLNFDSVGAGDLYVLTAEPMYTTKLTPELCDMVIAAAREDGIEVSVGVPSFGGTDASNLIKAGLLATSVVGISCGGFIENWHSLNDTPEAIDDEVLVSAVRLAIAFLRKIDGHLT